MIRLLNKVPDRITIALSGGPDSMAALHFFSKSKRDIKAVYFNHGTSHGTAAQGFVSDYCERNNIPLKIGLLRARKDPAHSLEEHWRIHRYNFLKEVAGDSPIITGHHLDDAVEWWIFSSLHGEGKLIPYKNDNLNVLRPLVLNRKQVLLSYLKKNEVPYIRDSSNTNTSFMRNYIRSELMPHALRVNPGLPKTIKKKYLNKK